MYPYHDSETGTFVKKAEDHDLMITRNIMRKIYDENPSYWPHGLSPEHHDGGVYLICKSATNEPIGFTGWQEREENGKRVGYYSIGILPEYRSQKFAKRAVSKLLAHKAASVDEVRAYIVEGNKPSIALANSLNVPVQLKSAGLRRALGWAATAGGAGATNAAFWDAWERKGVPFTGPWDEGRTVTNIGNATIGALGLLAGGLGGTAAKATRPGAAAGFMSALLGTPIKDLVVDLRHKMNRGDFDTKPPSIVGGPSAGPAKVDVNSNVDVNSKLDMDPKTLWSLLGAISVLGTGAYMLGNRGTKALEDIASQKDRGKIRVTLPTRNPGDEETQIEMPLDQIPISSTLKQKLERDHRRRLQAEVASRTRRRGVTDRELAMVD